MRAARLILAIGVGDEPPAILGLPERWGRTVLRCFYVMAMKWLVVEVTVERKPIVELLVTDSPALEPSGSLTAKSLPYKPATAPQVHITSPLAEALGRAFEQGPLGSYIRVDDWNTIVLSIYNWRKDRD
jgi:hypothetical protein